MMTNQGTSIGLAIDKSMQSFDMMNGVNKAIIVMSDGEDHEGNAEEVAESAYENNVIVAELVRTPKIPFLKELVLEYPTKKPLPKSS